MKNLEIYKKLNITRSFYSVFVKRFFDIFFSLLAIIILSPILLIAYLLTLIFVGCPAIYKQRRPGKDHKTFNIYKFRSMSNKKDKDGNLLPDSQRITWFGKILRKTSIDELPQLFNILKGDMSFIGPRPRLVKDMVFYDEDVYQFYIIRPGLTGPTQTTGRNANTWEQVFEKDIAYTHKIKFWTDLKIFVMTFVSVFVSTGETHSNMEEDKTKHQEYYYPDYALRIGKITKEQYDKGLAIADEIIKNKSEVGFFPELHCLPESAETVEGNAPQENIKSEVAPEPAEKVDGPKSEHQLTAPEPGDKPAGSIKPHDNHAGKNQDAQNVSNKNKSSHTRTGKTKATKNPARK